MSLGPERRTPAPLPASTLRYAGAPHIARSYDRLFADNALFAYDCDLLDDWFREPGGLLDLGCGTGRHVVHFARRGFDVTAVDLSPHMLQIARAKLDADGLDARFVEADMLRLDALGLGPFRYAVCMFSTLGMVWGRANRVEFLRAVRRRLLPGGLFAFHVHNALRGAWSPWGPLWLLGAWAWVRWRGLEFGDRIVDRHLSIPDFYLHLFTDAEVRRTAADAGWELVDLVYLNAARDGRLRSGAAARFAANGFVALARNRA